MKLNGRIRIKKFSSYASAFTGTSFGLIFRLLIIIQCLFLWQEIKVLRPTRTFGYVHIIVMVALHSRCGLYIFAVVSIFLIIIIIIIIRFVKRQNVKRLLWRSVFSSPNLSSRRLDVYHTSTHDVALVRI